MNDTDSLGIVRDALTAAEATLNETHMGTPLETIVHRGRAARRRHRLIGLTGTTAVAASVALVAGLAGAFGSAPAGGTSATRSTAFTLVKHANGTATLTLNWQVYLEPSTLQSDLQQDGIPAIVTSGSFCSSAPTPPGLGQVVIPPPYTEPWTITIDPAAMPAGTELSFGSFESLTGRPEPRDGPAPVAEAIIERLGQGGGQQNSAVTFVTLVDTSSYSCTGTGPSFGAIVPVPKPFPSK